MDAPSSASEEAQPAIPTLDHEPDMVVGDFSTTKGTAMESGVAADAPVPDQSSVLHAGAIDELVPTEAVVPAEDADNTSAEAAAPDVVMAENDPESAAGTARHAEEEVTTAGIASEGAATTGATIEGNLSTTDVASQSISTTEGTPQDISTLEEPFATASSSEAPPIPEPEHETLFPTDDTSSFGTPSSFSVHLSVDTDDDTDSALGSVAPNSSMSATSSVYEFVEEFGRTFHKYKEGKYFLPNDEQEIQRLDLQHRIAQMVLEEKLYLAPIDHPHRVLDVGTGTGTWAIEFAEANPEADVLGTDLSPIQPEYVPANCRFEIDDAEDEWIFTHRFDYVHGRYMCAFLSDFPKLFGQIFDNLNPGGWVEFMETLIYFQSQDGTLEGTALERWNRLLLDGIRNMGRNAMSCMKYAKWMEEAGYTNVTEQKFMVPTYPWARGRKNKTLGALQMANNLNGVYGLTITVFTKGLGWAKEEVEVLLADVRRDMSDRNIHAYITIMVTYGQKPV